METDLIWHDQGLLTAFIPTSKAGGKSMGSNGRRQWQGAICTPAIRNITAPTIRIHSAQRQTVKTG